jgi:hypothetical protein
MRRLGRLLDVINVTHLPDTIERWPAVVNAKVSVRARRYLMQRRDGIEPRSGRAAVVVGLALAAVALVVIVVLAASGGSGGGLY